MPGKRGSGEEEAPVLKSDFEGKDFLTRLTGDDEGLLVDFFEEVGGLLEGAAEGLDLLLLLCDGFGTTTQGLV